MTRNRSIHKTENHQYTIRVKKNLDHFDLEIL